jgi:hypothetical protein
MTARPESEFVISYIEKYLDQLNDPEEPLGKRTLARIIVRENPQLYGEEDIEKVRDIIRRYTGNRGNPSVKQRFDVQSADKGKAQKRASMPESHAKEKAPFVLPPGVLGVLSDIHLPYHNI